MKKAHGFLIGLGVVVAAGIPITWSMHSMQRMQAEVEVARAAAEEAAQKGEEASERAKEAEDAKAKAEAELLEEQRTIAREIAEEQARKAVEESTAVAWAQFLDTLTLLETLSETEDIAPEDALSQMISAFDAIPTNNVDSQVVSLTQSVQGVFEDFVQRIDQYDTDLKALDDRTPGTNFSAGVDGCSMVTTTLNTDSSFWNMVGCAAGLAAGAGISNENLKASAAELDKEFEADIDAMLDQFLTLDERMQSTASHISSEYGIETPDEFL